MNDQQINNCNKILLICGASETGKLSHAIVDAGFSVLVSTATDAFLEIGDEIEIGNTSEKISRRWGRLHQDGFVDLIEQENICAVVNACHPYATELRNTVFTAAEISDIPCINFIRAEGKHPAPDNCITAESHEKAAEIAFSFGKPVLLTTGSNNLIPYVKTARAKGIKIIARVLPRIESLAACFNAGLSDQEIIAARGPFSLEENTAVIKRFNAGVIVTKNSGKEGGFIEKVEASRICGCTTVIIDRPDTATSKKTFSDIYLLCDYLSKELFTAIGDHKNPLNPDIQIYRSTALQENSLSTISCDGKQQFEERKPINPILTASKNLHGGNIREIAEQSGFDADRIIDFSANINPLGPVPELKEILKKTVKEIEAYPDPEYKELIKAVSAFGGWDPDMVVPANGASELLYAAAIIANGKRALIPIPSYSDYTESAKRAGLKILHIATSERDNFKLDVNTVSGHIRKADLVFIGRPNNPTGYCINTDSLRELINSKPDSTFIVDESFLEFIPDTLSVAAALPRNAIMIRSMTKFYAIPGLRLGFAIAHPEIARKISGQLTPWSINCFAQAAGIASLKNKLYQKESCALVRRARTDFMQALSELPYLRVFPSDTNFLLIKLENGYQGAQLHKEFLKYGIAIRLCSNFPGLNDQFFRVAIKTSSENGFFVHILKKILE